MRPKGKAREVQVEGAQDKRADPSGREHSKPLGGDKLLPVASSHLRYSVRVPQHSLTKALEARISARREHGSNYSQFHV